jgi:hypothetical protein
MKKFGNKNPRLTPKMFAVVPIIVAYGLSVSENQSLVTLMGALKSSGFAMAQIVYPITTAKKL